jgi:tRNA pseudouridine13 synthase
MSELLSGAFSFAYAEPQCSASFKVEPEDFRVTELLGFEPCGSGEHVYLRIIKKDLNTQDLARQIARVAGLRIGDIGYSGLKDRWAVTDQWLSVYISNKKEPDWHILDNDKVSVVEVTRHQKKLRRGVHKNNAFEIVLRNFSGPVEQLESRIQQIAGGVPNYFGEQRFGWGGNNLLKAQQMFADNTLRTLKREKRSLYLSAARSFLFNKILSRRVDEHTWNHYMQGDLFSLEGSRSIFSTDCLDAVLEKRLQAGDIHPSGALWGRGDVLSKESVAELENQVVAPYAQLADGLAGAGLEQQRRALRLIPGQLETRWLDAKTALYMSFTLSAGSYATAVLRELVKLDHVEGSAGS